MVSRSWCFHLIALTSLCVTTGSFQPWREPCMVANLRRIRTHSCSPSVFLKALLSRNSTKLLLKNGKNVCRRVYWGTAATLKRNLSQMLTQFLNKKFWYWNFRLVRWWMRWERNDCRHIYSSALYPKVTVLFNINFYAWTYHCAQNNLPKNYPKLYEKKFNCVCAGNFP